MELQVGGVDDDHVGEAGEGEMVEGRHVKQLSSVPVHNQGEDYGLPQFSLPTPRIALFILPSFPPSKSTAW